MSISKILCASLVCIASVYGEEHGEANDSSKLPKWMFMDEIGVGVRGLNEHDSEGGLGARQMQYQFVAEGGFRLTPWLSLHAQAATGGDFSSSWNDSGLGIVPAAGSIYLKRAYLEAEPMKGVSFQYGGLGINRGTASDIVNYSEDGYMTGGRLAVRRPRNLYFDEISATIGYLGDRSTPGFQDRYQRLGQANYRQFLVTKKFGEGIEATVDYTDQAGAKTFRESLHVATPGYKVISGIRSELYRRVNFFPATGGLIAGEKEFGQRVMVEGGYAIVDRNFGDWNSENFFSGRRVYGSFSVRMTKIVSAFLMVNKAVGNGYTVPNDFHFHGGLRVDVLKGLRESGIL